MGNGFLFKLGLLTIIVFVTTLVGLIIGIIALVKISGYKRKHKTSSPIDEAQLDQVDSLSLSIPWLNNGFVSGLFMGFTIVVGLFAPIMLVLAILLNISFSSTAYYLLSLFSYVLGIVLAIVFSRMTKKTINKIGLNTIGYTGKKSSRVLLAILGMIVGFITGYMCVSIVLAPFM